MNKPAKHLTRKDLAGFDKDAIELLLWAQDQGARLRVTKKGHCLVYAPDGESTATVPPNFKSVNRGGSNARAAVSRLFKRN